ncbi:carboxypeptidase-like regulatory domain-containing protein [Cystobacter fuscus]
MEGVHLQLTSTKSPSEALSVATSGAEGRFTLDAPGPGNWWLAAYPPGSFPEEVELSAPARDVRVVLRRGASLEAEVVDEAGRPLEHVEVFVRGHERGVSVTTDARGRAVFRSLVPGSVTVSACAAEKGRAASLDVPLADRESRTVRLVLPEGGFLSGRMEDERGLPWPGRACWRRPLGAGARCPPTAGGRSRHNPVPTGASPWPTCGRVSGRCRWPRRNSSWMPRLRWAWSPRGAGPSGCVCPRASQRSSSSSGHGRVCWAGWCARTVGRSPLPAQRRGV